MILSLWNDYYDFFIILIGIIIGMVLAYIIFFRPSGDRTSQRKHKKKTEELESNNINHSQDESLEDEEIYETFDDGFILGENSNILESIDSNGNNQFSYNDLKNFGLEDVNINSLDKLDNESIESKDISDSEEAKEELSDEPDFDAIYESDSLADPEEEIDKIVQSVIQKPSLADDKAKGKFHVLYRKEDHKWYVKREGEKEVSSFLITQKEAIAYATIQALIYETTIVVHDEEGKIVKYDI